MAKKLGVGDDGKRGGPVGKRGNWSRTGGAIGSEEMGKMEDWNKSGAGVSESEKPVGDMPNEGNELPGKLGGKLR